MIHVDLEKHFEDQWNNPPKPFNLDFIPNHKDLIIKLNKSMEKFEPFKNRNERKIKRRFEYIKLIETDNYPTIKEL